MHALAGVEIGQSEFTETCRGCNQETTRWTAVVRVHRQELDEDAEPLTVICPECVTSVMGAVTDAISASLAVSRG